LPSSAATDTNSQLEAAVEVVSASMDSKTAHSSSSIGVVVSSLDAKAPPFTPMGVTDQQQSATIGSSSSSSRIVSEQLLPAATTSSAPAGQTYAAAALAGLTSAAGASALQATADGAAAAAPAASKASSDADAVAALRQWLDPPAGTTELPTCPVCLERLDEHISGIVSTVSHHGM
jgi:hypothetical protein